MNLRAIDRNIVARNAGQLTAGKDKRTDKKLNRAGDKKKRRKNEHLRLQTRISGQEPVDCRMGNT